MVREKMYKWRKWSEEEREHVSEFRRDLCRPMHCPPHISKGNCYHITSACYEHRHLIAKSEVRMKSFYRDLLLFCKENSEQLHAWCLLPNHYHLLISLNDLKSFIKAHGQFHGRTSFQWNGEDESRGRQCFHSQSDRYIRSEHHFWVTMNYIHNNPVHHDYVSCWQDWEFSSAQLFLDEYGRELMKELWLEYPLKDYGKAWD